MKRASLLLPCAALLLALAILTGCAPLGFAAWVRTVSLGAAAAGVLLVLAVLLPAGEPRLRCVPAGLLAFAVLLRLLVLPAPFLLSEDAARYHWDGKVLAHGISPYAFPPDSPELAGLPAHSLDREMSEVSRENLAVYPPLAEAAFALAYLLAPGRYLGLQLLWLLAEVAAWVLLARELAERGLPRIRLLILAWSPLLLTTGYLPGHVDVLCLPFVVLLIRAVRRRRPLETGIWLALAVLVKPFPAVLLPAVWAELGTRRTARVAAAAAGVIALAYLPFLGDGAKLLSSSWLMAREWTHNGTVADLLELAVGGDAARVLSAVLFAGLAAAAVRWGRDFPSRCLLIAASFAICMPFLFPWYVLFFLPLLALRPDPALLALVTLLPISDLVLVGYEARGVWEQPLWARLLLWGTFYGLLVGGAVRRWGMFAGAAPPSSSPSLAAKT